MRLCLVILSNDQIFFSQNPVKCVKITVCYIQKLIQTKMFQTSWTKFQKSCHISSLILTFSTDKKVVNKKLRWHKINSPMPNFCIKMQTVCQLLTDPQLFAHDICKDSSLVTNCASSPTIVKFKMLMNNWATLTSINQIPKWRRNGIILRVKICGVCQSRTMFIVSVKIPRPSSLEC